jgi:hypothetical protein
MGYDEKWCRAAWLVLDTDTVKYRHRHTAGKPPQPPAFAQHEVEVGLSRFAAMQIVADACKLSCLSLHNTSSATLAR